MGVATSASASTGAGASISTTSVYTHIAVEDDGAVADLFSFADATITIPEA